MISCLFSNRSFMKAGTRHTVFSPSTVPGKYRFEILYYRTNDSPIVKAGMPLLQELVALSGLAQGSTLSLLDCTNALPSVLLCLCPDVPSWKISPILSKYPILTSKLHITTRIHHSVFSAQTPAKVCFFPTPYLWNIPIHLYC